MKPSELGEELLREAKEIATSLGMASLGPWTHEYAKAEPQRVVVCSYAGNDVAEVTSFKGTTHGGPKPSTGKKAVANWWIRVLHRATGQIGIRDIRCPREASLKAWLAVQLSLALDQHRKAKAATDAAVALCMAVPAPMVRHTHTITAFRARPGEVDVVVTLAPEDVAPAVAAIDGVLKQALRARYEERQHERKH